MYWFIIGFVSSSIIGSGVEFLLDDLKLYGFLVCFVALLVSFQLNIWCLSLLVSFSAIEFGLSDSVPREYPWLGLTIPVALVTFLICERIFPGLHETKLIGSRGLFLEATAELTVIHQLSLSVATAMCDRTTEILFEHVNIYAVFGTGLGLAILTAFMMPCNIWSLVSFSVAASGFSVGTSALPSALTSNSYIRAVFGLLLGIWGLFLPVAVHLFHRDWKYVTAVDWEL